MAILAALRGGRCQVGGPRRSEGFNGLSIRGFSVSQQDKAFMRSFMMVLAVLAAIAMVFYIIAHVVTSDEDEAGTTTRMEDKIKENIAPVGQVNVGEAPAPAAAAGAATQARSGEQVYNTTCMACHGTGAAGAPKVGDKAAWEPRASQGLDTLLNHAVNGLRAMPPKGTCANCSDEELKGAIEYMLQQTGV